ncbi:ATP-binding response regulator [Leptolyngbya sp. NIES-2104]|uniref:ATP-binding response regulator n=1 Tax=Leptolyngbya sp. NIES-2104 TaxID=1552121 RepID=UPI0006EC9BF5|nr:hybrid sensor histidine kinase/response regulator [Leptolyngbya sp. NIES-2104]GAP97361.1 signal transduction histidine kinase [Leptolyngbya sp. NIES-2104]
MKQQRTILIVDRSLVDRQTYQQYLSQTGEVDHQFLHADSGFSALQICHDSSLHAVLLSSDLVDFPALELLTKIEPFLPIVVIVPEIAIAHQFLQSGAKDYILKHQITPELLQHTLQSAILRQQFSHPDLTQQLRRNQIALKQSEERLRLALEVAHMGAWEWDLVTGVLSWSPNYAELVGLDPNHCPTTLEGWEATIHPHDRAQAQTRLDDALKSGAELHNEYRIVKPTGEIRWLNCKGQIERNDQGTPIRMLGVTQDVTEMKRQELHRSRLLKQEKAARVEAETANQNKDEFLAVVTHELRTPLNAILGWAKLLRTRNLDSDSIDRALETIERNAESQSQLIEDLLDVSRIIRGRLALKLMSVSLYAVLSAAIEGVKLSAESKQLQLDFNAMDLDATISGDPKRLQQIFLNLLTNAIKFTPQGGKIIVQLTSTDTTAQIRVMDTGIGIQADFLPHVFDRFRQDQSNAASEQGLGLGLAIVRQLVELHKGSISVASAGENQGTTFTVCFPLRD